ncbi:group III truncated hemoglobin [Aequorivita vladivostokensis]|jgi:hemoglobin|uniref:Globin n=1 Tax=Aequorivita vladivostokensis TaxID=171194 RepID=A0ABR5DJP0_9FLAO|nr:group III truncated hemoglobin [Aequorivita vladivostokensis]KJJ38996.1 globin [Aequorivita vladivostokensis]
MTKDILKLDDVKHLVDSFYGKIREDKLLKEIFNSNIQDRWPQHLQKMYTFWQTVLLSEHTYYGSPFPPHAKMPIDKEHFDRWLQLWFDTIDENFTGEIADEAKWRASKMAEMFQFKINYIREKSGSKYVQ